MSETVLDYPPVEQTEIQTEPSVGEHETREFESVKDFSKEASVTERAQLASDLRTRRRNFRVSRTELQQQVAAMSSEHEQLQLRAELALAKCKEAGLAISELKTARVAVLPELFSQMKQFLNHGEISKQTDAANEQQSELEILQSRQAEIDVAVTELQAQINDDAELCQARTALKDFYAKESESWQEYEAERQAGNVQKLSKEYGVLFVHGIGRYTPDDNSLLLSSVGTEDKFRIALALSPTLSTSTISPGDGRGNYWASQGFILGNGTVTEAHSRDAATKPRGLFGRTSVFQHEKKPIAEQFQSALGGNNYSGERKYTKLL